MRLLSLIILFISINATAQVGGIKVHLNSGRVISTRYAYLYSSYRSCLIVHERRGEKISIHDVDHVEGTDENGHYRYFVPVMQTNKIWAERSFVSERITLYHTDIATGTMATGYKPKNCLYSKDGAPMRPVRLRFLKKELADCPESMKHLEKAKKIAAGQAVVYTVSYSLILGGFIALVKGSHIEEPTAPGEMSTGPVLPPALVVGALGAWIPIALESGKTDRCVDALKAYK